jgi:cytochrome c-type biogenesis protein CcmH
MMKRLAALLLSLCLPLAAPAQPMGDPTPLQYRDSAEEARFHALTAELRCVQCQNQSLADSNAQIAHDLRREVLVLMHEGHSDAEIKQFLVERYGEFVLYRPRMQGSTLLLWLTPGVLLLAGAALLVVQVRRRRQAAPLPAAEDASQEDRQW